MERSELAIIVPALNEASSIRNVIYNARKYGEIILVDDGSIDDTSKIAENLGVIILSHDRTLGYDESLNTGFKYAYQNNYKYVITIDADGQHPVEEISKFIQYFELGSEIIVGCRPYKQRIAEIIFALLTNFRWGINDPLCGMKGYSIDVYRALGFFDSYKSIGTELMLFGLVKNRKIKEHNIEIKRRQDKARFGIGIKANYRIFRSLIIGLFRYR